MRTGHAFLATLHLLSLTQCASAWFYLDKEWIGEAFFDGWDWETENDPTHGRVNYVSQADAMSKNLSYVEDGQFFMRADDVSIVDTTARGRDSIRISSRDAWEEAIFVLDVEHMPAGCSTWPAWWTLSRKGPWPNGGEIDIIEGVNLNVENQATLHTTPECQMPPDYLRQPQSGTSLNTDCDTSVDNNAGCGARFSNSGPSYGKPFNENHGGYYTMVKSPSSGIQVWFWPRDSPDIPTEIRHGVSNETTIYPTWQWGEPAANFPMLKDYCDYHDHFNAHRMVFDLTFCGDWAGNVWSTSGCGPTTCVDFVNNNPSAFSEAYWTINSLRVYTPK
ncbi:concanavalin A-like lectin/glucanase domain-containing protein [Russula earlei]|uniref:Concanavalin A-like lectin/glucanase domain-containing protein n=1 Tax=Russula earlei TaxID=71964 RepID=A0ACC0UGR5_9AGAM|nr:concanavalin A-like lectin/glucanase domain-containing protein [Russula earlei]